MKNEKILTQAMIASMFCWGLGWASNKVLASYGSATAISFYRFLITTISLLVLVFFLKEKITFNLKTFWIVLLSSICLSLYTYYFIIGLSVGLSGAGGVLVTTLNPIITFILTLLLTLKKPNKMESLGLIVGAIAACILLKIWDNLNALLTGGNIFFLIATSLWSILSRFTSLSKQFSTPIIFSLWMYFICSLTMLFLSDSIEIINIFKQSDTMFWLNMFFSGTITTSIATTIYFYATTKLGVNKASSFIFLVPLSASIGSWIFLSEIPQWHTVLGGILGVLAVYIISKENISIK
jgi:drug/metabolite transporter (DMT)-like permease